MELDANECLDVVMKFYKEMKPFVGDRYDNTGKNGLMLVGESHYLPEDTRCDRTPNVWYQGCSVLDDEDRIWISTSDIIEEEAPQGFPNRAHSIWRLSANAIISGLSLFDDKRASVIQSMYRYVAALNFFVRPAQEGESIGPELDRIDIDVAKLRFDRLIKELNPRAVIVLSALVCGCINADELKMRGIDYLFAPHPGCSWWNRPSMRYGVGGGRGLVTSFVKNLKLNWR